MRFNWLIVLLLTSIIGWSSELDSLRAEKRGDNWVIIHQVDPGETLYAITRRYKADLSKVVELNSIQNNTIRSGQLLEIPVELKEGTTSKPVPIEVQNNKIHVVQSGETLFAIGRKYGVKASEIVSWNNLQTESLRIGQRLSIGSARTLLSKENPPLLPFKNAIRHYVQLGETMEKISVKRNVSEDSLRRWNNLQNNDIKIGQILWYRHYDRSSEPMTSKEVYGKHIVEGIARQIDDMDATDKYLALHKELPTGTLLEVRNLMNNKKVYVRIVGQLPSTGVNQDVLIRLTPISFKRLGILDARARVELTYYDE